MALPLRPVVIIDAGRIKLSTIFADLIAFRNVFLLLVKRDLQIRYSQTFLGILWVILQPASATLAFWLVFGKLAHVPSEGVPYPLFALAGLVPWMFFSNGISNAGNSLLNNSAIIGKVYFPRMLIPFAAVAGGTVDFAISFLIQIGASLYSGVFPSLWRIPFFFLLTAILVALTLGVGMTLSVLTVKYRDIRHALPFVIQFALFVTPISYPAKLLPHQFSWLGWMNPVAGIIEGYRSFWFNHPIDWSSLGFSGLVTLMFLAASTMLFQHREAEVADIL